MKRISLPLLALVLLTSSLWAGPVEDFCAEFAAGAEVRIYRGFPKRLSDRDRAWIERARKAECFELLGEVFYPEVKTLNEKDTAAWLAVATNPKNYYTSSTGTGKPDPNFRADIAFWYVTPDHKNQVYGLASFETSQMKIAFTVDATTYAMTLDLEKSCRELLQRIFEQEIKDEQQASAQQSPPKNSLQK